MKMKLNALSLAIAAGFIGTAAQAGDVAMFPYVVNSSTVTTIVSVVDRGDTATQRYNASGNIGTIAGNSANNRLHWRLTYKAGTAATDNLSSCQEVNYYLPSSPNDLQTVDLGGKFGSTTKGVLFSDASVNNNWNANTTSAINFMLGKAAGDVQRGLLTVNNADAVAGNYTVYGEAMVFEFGSGAAWGYQAAQSDSGAAHANSFRFDTTGGQLAANSVAALTGAPTGVLTFMRPSEVTTRLFVTPMNDPDGYTSGTSTQAAYPNLLTADGANSTGWNVWQTRVSLSTTAAGGSGAGVAFDRDENLVSGSVTQSVRCVGAVDVPSLMTSGATSALVDGGWANLVISNPPIPLDGSYLSTNVAFVTKLEYSSGSNKFNGEATTGTFNNAFIMR